MVASRFSIRSLSVSGGLTFLYRSFGLSDDGRKCLRLLNRDVGEDLSIEFDLCKVEAMYELRILNIIQPARRIYTNDPQLAKIPLFQLTAGVGEIQTAFDRLFGRTVKL